MEYALAAPPPLAHLVAVVWSTSRDDLASTLHEHADETRPVGCIAEIRQASTDCIIARGELSGVSWMLVSAWWVRSMEPVLRVVAQQAPGSRAGAAGRQRARLDFSIETIVDRGDVILGAVVLAVLHASAWLCWGLRLRQSIPTARGWPACMQRAGRLVRAMNECCHRLALGMAECGRCDGTVLGAVRATLLPDATLPGPAPAPARQGAAWWAPAVWRQWDSMALAASACQLLAQVAPQVRPAAEVGLLAWAARS